MKKYFLIVILIVFVFGLLTGCAKIEDVTIESQIPDEVIEPVDPACLTGTTVRNVPLNENGQYYPIYIGAYTVRPNKGCNLPSLYCIYANNGDDNGGPTCVVIEE